jgi:hypothetical protein
MTPWGAVAADSRLRIADAAGAGWGIMSAGAETPQER